MDEEAMTEVVIKRSADPSKVTLMFIDDDSRELQIDLSYIDSDSDTEDVALLRLAASLIEKYGGVRGFIDACLSEVD